MTSIEQRLTSMEVAEMVEKEHSKLLRDIRVYVENLNQSKIGFVDFFTESTYQDAKGEVRPCYMVTKKGCEFIGNKLTGQKGAVFTARYINRFHEMEDVITQVVSTRSLTTDDYITASKIIATAKRETLPYVLDFLKKAGLDIPKIEKQIQVRAIEQIAPSVTQYLQGHDIVNKCTNDVYRDYIKWCIDNDLDYVNNITFSKQVNVSLGTAVISKRVNGDCRRIFVMMN